LDLVGDGDLFFAGDFAGEGGFSATAGSNAASSAWAAVLVFFGDGAPAGPFLAFLAASRAFPMSTSATERFPPAPPEDDMAAPPAAAAASGGGTASALLGLAGGFFSTDLAPAAVAAVERRPRGEAEE
jgi:hypothetical protein